MNEKLYVVGFRTKKALYVYVTDAFTKEQAKASTQTAWRLSENRQRDWSEIVKIDMVRVYNDYDVYAVEQFVRVGFIFKLERN